MISATNIGTSQRVKKDYKKGTTELVTTYTPIGLIDDFLDPKEEEGSKFSMAGRVRNMSAHSAKRRIDQLRRHQGSIINAAKPPDHSSLDSVFVCSSKGNETYTLSVYNRPDKRP